MRFVLALSGILAPCALLLVAAGSETWAQEHPGIPVSVAQPLAKRITQWDEYSGRFEALNTVEVRPRVSGFIEQVHFKDGQMIKQGDLLFTIDKRPFEIAVDIADAELSRVQAQVQLQTSEVERGRPLIKTGALTERDFDLRKSNLAVAKAQELGAMASLKNAQLQLEWTEVRAAIDGRISDRKVDVGNLVNGGTGTTTLLATIVTTDPIHFVFDVSETDFLRYARLNAAGARASSRDADNPVRIKLADEKVFMHQGHMDFVDNVLSARSGTLRGRAVIDNKDQFLQPGLFGRLQLYGGEFDTLLIPDSAVVSDQARKIVFVVDAEDKVKPAPVELGMIADGLRVVLSGLKPQDRIIIDGLANPAVRPGAKVKAEPGQIVAAN